MVFLPAEISVDEVAGLEVRPVRFHDLPEPEAAHHGAELDRGRVAAHVAHPDPVRGIERQVERADERLALADGLDLLFGQHEVAVNGGSHRAPHQAVRTGCDGRAHDRRNSRSQASVATRTYGARAVAISTRTSSTPGELSG